MPLWIGVLGLLGVAMAVFNYAFYLRVVKLVLQGKETARFDQPLVRLKGALLISLGQQKVLQLSLIHISEPTRLGMKSFAVFCLKKKKTLTPHIDTHIPTLSYINVLAYST